MLIPSADFVHYCLHVTLQYIAYAPSHLVLHKIFSELVLFKVIKGLEAQINGTRWRKIPHLLRISNHML